VCAISSLKSSRSLSHLLMSPCLHCFAFQSHIQNRLTIQRGKTRIHKAQTVIKYAGSYVITGRPNGPVLFCSLASVVVVVFRRLSGSVTLHGQRAGGFICAGQAMTSCRLQSNYSSTLTLHGGPVRLRPVRATPYLT